MSDKKIYKKLPVVHQTAVIKNFFESTVEQLFSKSNTELVQGFIGSRTSDDVNLSSEYLKEPTVTKRYYALSPTVNSINEITGVNLIPVRLPTSLRINPFADSSAAAVEASSSSLPYTV